MTEAEMDFDGTCPFLMCLKDEPHKHPVCGTCGAVRHGNLFCDECIQFRETNGENR